MVQLSFDFPFQEKYAVEDFIVLPENKFLFDFVNNYNVENNNLPKSFSIIGPKSSGKTHLANIWQNKTDAELINPLELERINLTNFSKTSFGKAYLIEDVDKISEEIKLQKMLFYLFNLIQENNSVLMITSKIKLNQFDYKFPDIESRLRNIYNLEIQQPSAELIKMLLIKNFSSKQLAVQDSVIDFLSKNINRSFESIDHLIKLIEFYCFERKKPLTIPLVRQLLAMQI